jgi:hypothetical protein
MKNKQKNYDLLKGHFNKKAAFLFRFLPIIIIIAKVPTREIQACRTENYKLFSCSK